MYFQDLSEGGKAPLVFCPVTSIYLAIQFLAFRIPASTSDFSFLISTQNLLLLDSDFQYLAFGFDFSSYLVASDLPLLAFSLVFRFWVPDFDFLASGFQRPIS